MMLDGIRNSRLMRFFGVSSVGTAADYVSALALHTFLGVPGAVASTLGFLVGAMLNYVGHHHITFGAGKDGPVSALGFLRYFAAVAVSLLIRLAVLVGLEHATAWPFWIVLSIAFAASFFSSYFISLLWVFRRST